MLYCLILHLLCNRHSTEGLHTFIVPSPTRSAIPTPSYFLRCTPAPLCPFPGACSVPLNEPACFLPTFFAEKLTQKFVPGKRCVQQELDLGAHRSWRRCTRRHAGHDGPEAVQGAAVEEPQRVLAWANNPREKKYVVSICGGGCGVGRGESGCVTCFCGVGLVSVSLEYTVQHYFFYSGQYVNIKGRNFIHLSSQAFTHSPVRTHRSGKYIPAKGVSPCTMMG